VLLDEDVPSETEAPEKRRHVEEEVEREELTDEEV